MARDIPQLASPTCMRAQPAMARATCGKLVIRHVTSSRSFSSKARSGTKTSTPPGCSGGGFNSLLDKNLESNVERVVYREAGQ
jgi:hypothetical protein